MHNRHWVGRNRGKNLNFEKAYQKGSLMSTCNLNIDFLPRFEKSLTLPLRRTSGLTNSGYPGLLATRIKAGLRSIGSRSRILAFIFLTALASISACLADDLRVGPLFDQFD